MALARWQATIVDDAGNTQASASVEVRDESDNSLVSIFSDRDGVTPLSNPMSADSEGFAAFHTFGGAYKITATKGAFSRVWRYVGIGTAGEYDVEGIVVDIAAQINGSTSKATPVDADELALVDSAASNVLKKLTWANLNATLKTYFDTLYVTISGALGTPSSGTLTNCTGLPVAGQLGRPTSTTDNTIPRFDGTGGNIQTSGITISDNNDLNNIGGGILTGNGVSTGDCSIEFGGSRTGDGNAYFDLHATSGADYELRWLRLGGTNGVSSFAQKGTGDFAFITEGAAALDFRTTATSRFKIASGGNIYAPGAGTTASAANAFLNSGSSPANELLRSTSSLRYKTDIEPLDAFIAEKALTAEPIYYKSLAKADNPDWSWYGYTAEAVAAIDPRLVHWGYAEEDYDAIQVPNPKMARDKVQTYRTEFQLKDGAQLKPDGVMYDRLAVLQIYALTKKVEALTSAVAELQSKLG